MDSEELDRMNTAIKEEESEDGINLTPKDVNMLRKPWNSEVTIEEYMAVLGRRLSALLLLLHHLFGCFWDLSDGSDIIQRMKHCFV